MPKSYKEKSAKYWESEFKKLEAAYKTSEKKYWELIELIPLGIFEYNADGIIHKCNPFGLEMMGYTKEDLEQGISILNVAHPEEIDKVKDRFARLSLFLKDLLD